VSDTPSALRRPLFAFFFPAIPIGPCSAAWVVLMAAPVLAGPLCYAAKQAVPSNMPIKLIEIQPRAVYGGG
jgi:hypothetical protein